MARTKVGKYVLYIGTVVIALILITGGWFFFRVRSVVLKSNTELEEKILTEELTQIRASIKRYSLEKDAPPQSLPELVTSGYLPYILRDPVTKEQSWQVEIGDYETKSGKKRGVVNVHSRSNQQSSLGTPYSQW